MSLGTLGGRPVLVLKEGVSRTRGEEARRLNIMAAKAVAETVKTTLGPRGMDKMIVDSLGDVTISNDGAAILEEMEVAHPAAKLMVNLAKGQDKEVGDGTTTAVVLAGEILAGAEHLLNKDIHPTIILEGLQKSLKKAEEVLEGAAVRVDPEDEDLLKSVATTAMSSKLVKGGGERLARVAVEAMKAVAEERGGKTVADVENVKIMKKRGKSLLDSEFVKGVILDKEIVHRDMPRRIKGARIALVNLSLEVKKPEIDLEIQITSPDELRAFMDQEAEILRDKVEKVTATGANVVFCQKGIDDVAQGLLARKGVIAVRRVSQKDIERLKRATGGMIVNSLDGITGEALSRADLVEERKIGEDRMIFIEGCPEAKSVTLLLRAGGDTILDEAERGMKDALYVVRNTIEDRKLVYGGGSIQLVLANGVRDLARQVGGKEQLAMEAFADALESICRILAENAGMDAVDTLMRLRKEHSAGRTTLGVDVFAGDLGDMAKLGVHDAYRSVKNSVSGAIETSTLILRTDDMITARPYEAPPKGMPGEEGEGPPDLGEF